MARKKLTVKQGATRRFSLRWPGVNLLLYDIYCQVRVDYASSAAKAAAEPLFECSLVDSVEDGMAYGAAVDGIVDTVVVTFGADKTALLVNQSNDQDRPSHRSDAFFVRRSDAVVTRISPYDFDVHVTPRTTVVP